MEIFMTMIILFPLSILEGRVSKLLIPEVRGRTYRVPSSCDTSTKGIMWYKCFELFVCREGVISGDCDN